ncbi:Taurine dioxygenase, alpha-ketoglutarate-dependent [Amycolatopsis marina]|uniref:Taurine dioxygenase, alpha-ketoglutarate-dependent n=1 Tax=Amycolatopsis marina TaxID=490629 RepID=A0A1I1B0W3_9PSEU|nr:TauD/TfdA family dioxygenase [Amycolatopsis marina]SFB43985.1 Taurine dioxygenase, alpha-ketoglutarate-dependent [Amycolatopsis marina]
MTADIVNNPAEPLCRIEGNSHTRIAVYEATGLDWVRANLAGLQARLRTHGAILLRGLPVDLDLFNQVIEEVGGELLTYTERSTPRSAVAGNIYTSTEYPPAESIPMHNENSYSATWPERLFFLCDTAAETGGATPIADSRVMFRLLPAELRARFAAGVTYTRAFREGLGLTWQEAFQTEDPAVVEDYCARNGQTLEWTDEGLRTRHLRPSFVDDPHTGETVWFNQVNLFHVSSLGAEVSEALLELYPEEDLPRNAYFADGSPIPEADLADVKDTYDAVSYAFPWEQGDIMVINNMLMAHGRQPFTGKRRILVAMT